MLLRKDGTSRSLPHSYVNTNTSSSIGADHYRETENGDIAIIWLGQAVSPQILHDLYGADSLDELSTRMVGRLHSHLPSFID